MRRRFLTIVAKRAAQPVQPFLNPSSRQPEWLQRRRQRQGHFDIGVLQTPGECRSQVIDFGFRPLDAPFMVGIGRLIEECGHRGVVVPVACPHFIALARLVQFLLRVLTDGFQQPITGAMSVVLGDHERLVDQQRELIEYLVALRVGFARDSVCGADIEAAEKHCQPSEQHLLGLAQQRVRPVHRCAQRLLATHRGAGSARQQAELVTQTVEDLGRRQCTDSGRGKLDGQWKAIEPAADLGDGFCIVSTDAELGFGPSCAVAEQFDRFVGQRQRRHSPAHLARHADRLATCGQKN